MGTVGTIVNLDIDPSEIEIGDYLHRTHYGALHVTAKPKKMGMVWRVPGLSKDIGSDCAYPPAGELVRVTRGYATPGGTEAEHLQGVE